MDITLKNSAPLVAKTTIGWVSRYSQGEYPWSSSVILEGEKDGKAFKWVYPTEINPRGQLEVDHDLQQLLVELEAPTLAKVKWSRLYPKTWDAKTVLECRVIGSLYLDHLDGVAVQVQAQCAEVGTYLGDVSKTYDWTVVAESDLCLLQEEERTRSRKLVQEQKANLEAFLDSGETGDYYPMWSPLEYGDN